MFLNVHVLCLATERRVLGMKPRAVVYTDGVNTSPHGDEMTSLYVVST